MADSSSSFCLEFFEVANRYPEHVALVDGHERLSYRQTASLVLDLARRLREAGVQPSDIVAVSMMPSARMVAAMLGIMAAGAAYLPMDAAWGDGRREEILDLSARTNELALLIRTSGQRRNAVALC